MIKPIPQATAVLIDLRRDETARAMIAP